MTKNNCNSTVERDIMVRQYLSNKRELLKYQREYKNLLDTKLLNRKETVMQRSVNNNLEYLNKEKLELKTQLYVTNAKTHTREYNKRINTLACHVACQDKLSADNELLKSRIITLEKQIHINNRCIYELNRKTVPDAQHIQHVAKARKILDILENRIEVSKFRESKLFSENAKLRSTIIDMLHHRALFNKFWHKMISHLNRDKKYLVDLVEYAIGTFDNVCDIYQKFNAVEKKQAREIEMRKNEMQGVLQKLTRNQNNHEFLISKAKQRKLKDLEPREYKRREITRNTHRNKIVLYSNVLKKILSFAGVSEVKQAIDKFLQQESLYYSYFNYANELTYKMANLNNCINDLYKSIETYKHEHSNTLDKQLITISQLQKQLRVEQLKAQSKIDASLQNENRLQSLFNGFQNIFNLARCDPSSMAPLLGNHKKITVFNVQRFLKILEHRLNKIIAYVFISQKDRIRPTHWTVRSVARNYDEPTDVDDIVLVQQCPECAEGEDVNPYDMEYVEPLGAQQIKKKLREKVPQPEMQYRLHSLSQCRLPRSRLLANKRF